MTVRWVGVLSRPHTAPQPPPGVSGAAYRLALLEDTYEVVSGLDLVSVALCLCPGDQPEAEALVWPGTPVVRLPIRGGDSAGMTAASKVDLSARAAEAAEAAEVHSALEALGELGAESAIVLAPDAPDLPGLLIGKLFRALGTADIAVCPASDGSVVAVAAKLPLSDWYRDAQAGLDPPDAVSRLRAAAPRRRALAVGPGWHRLRRPADVTQLDPGLEGWDATRLLLSSGSP